MEVNCVSINVEDMEESLKFYKDVMGLKLVQEYVIKDNGLIKVLADKDGSLIELIKAPSTQVGFNALRVNTSNIKKDIENFRKNGYKIILEIIETPISYNAVVQDPNGVNLTIVELKKAEDSAFVKENIH